MSAPVKQWTFDACVESAKSFSTRTEWKNAARGAYGAATRNEWLEQCCAHMVSARLVWTLDACVESAKGFETRTSWKKANTSAYNAACRNDWLEQCCAHMSASYTFWTLEKCLKSASEFGACAEWRKAQKNAYNAAYRHGWLEQCCAHMPAKKRLKEQTQAHKRAYTKWTLEACVESASAFDTRIKWKKTAVNAYGAACRNDWLEQCCKHMKKKVTQPQTKVGKKDIFRDPFKNVMRQPLAAPYQCSQC